MRWTIEGRGIMRLLVIEDDSTMRRFLGLILKEEGFVVDATGEAEEGRVLALTNDYDGVVLDLSLPDGHGIDVIRAIRREGRLMPLVVFSGTAEKDQIIEALDAGADDYITKPTDASLIRARVRALVRRGRAGKLGRGGTLQLGNVSLNVAIRRALAGDNIIPLTPKEMLLLQVLLLHPGEVVTRSELMEKVWDMHFDPGSNVVDTHVSRLKTKLRNAGATVAVAGVRGAGFLLRESSNDDGTEKAP